MSNDLRTLRPEFRLILQNRDVIAIDQDPLGVMGKLVRRYDTIRIYVKPVMPIVNGLTSFAIAIVNMDYSHIKDVGFTYESLGLGNIGRYELRNLWTGAGHRNTASRLKEFWEIFVPKRPLDGIPGGRLGSVGSMDCNIKRKKGVNWTIQENELVIELFLDCYDTYYFKFSDGSKKGIKAVRDSLHERWAEQLNRLGFAERTPAQVAEKIKKSIIITRKYINNNGENIRTGRVDDLPPFLRPLEKKLREEYAKQANGYDLSSEDSALRFYDLLKDVKEESMSSTGGKDASDSHSVDLDIEPSTSVLFESPMTRLSRMANITQSPDPPVVPVLPFMNTPILPTINGKIKKRPCDEELEDLAVKRQRLLDAELELLERKRHLVEMKIKYWEEKTKRLSSTT
ncbi:hypothetical protein GCK32_009338 [Trichostrongylus colubriformis]|uniref:Uncharacterized protein n=1 Tax=Trichostrongylus colubriformis TaxID=6319 RepID=A0AAN8F6K3_TRICO